MTKQIGVGVGAFILNEQQQLLLVKRKKQPEAQHWSLPGGKVEYMETLENAIIREIKEELNIVIEPQRLLCVTNHIIASPAAHFVAPTFAAKIIAGTVQNMEPHSASAIGFFALDNLPQPLTITTINALRYYKAQEN